ncbi:MAG TPA: AAA family ATPase [Candidatus Paceibacterota bacterium]|nr:AAA family ATPase [Candidatus Paceibacterota bacterium]
MMVKKQIIAITGNPGSGKSSTADLLAEKLGFKRFSAGDLTRKVALEMGMSLNELSLQQNIDPTVDQRVDEELKKAGEVEKSVIDARMAFHFIPESFKVYLDLPPEIAKERISNNLKENALRKESEDSSTPEEIYKKITARLESERKRYQDLYGVDHTDRANFDLVIDTNKNNLEEVVDIIIAEYQKWRE